jgi:hypothetical protein
VDASRTARARVIAFWIVTVLVVQENVSGFFWALLHLDFITANLAHLGYPPYFSNVIGIGQLLCALAILAPLRCSRYRRAPTRSDSERGKAPKLDRARRRRGAGPLRAGASAARGSPR